jgi:hypothetical protein
MLVMTLKLFFLILFHFVCIAKAPFFDCVFGIDVITVDPSHFGDALLLMVGVGVRVNVTAVSASNL